MKRALLPLLLILSVFYSSAQDMGVTAITAPVSGCNLSSTSNVTVRIFNYGPNVVTPFNVSYTINAGVPVTETINTVILSNSTYTYTFATPANLSAPGNYTFTAYTSLPGDINPTNDAVTNYIVTSDAPSVGGTVTGGTNVCSGSNSGTLNVSGQTGNILRWEYSTDDGNTWINISNTSTSQSYLNLTAKTLYRVVTQSGSCPASTSTIDSIRIDQPTVGGTLAGTTTVCSGTNAGTITLSGQTGSVLYWEFSTNGGATWTNIANTANTQTYSNLTGTRVYRAAVQNGACPQANSLTATITVSPQTVAGTITGSDTVCSTSNSGSLILSGNVGAVIRWQYSVNNGATWTNITNTTTTQTYSNLGATRLYRAQVRSGGCPQLNSDTAQIVVDPPTIPGTVTGGSTVCSGSSGTLTLTGASGTVQNWETSTDGGNTWLIISNTATTYNYTNITTTSLFRALVKSGECAAAYSGTTEVTVDAASSGGTVASSATVCSGSNGSTLTLSSFIGAIQEWAVSTDNGVTWTSFPNTTTAQSYSNLTTSTQYVAIVKNGVCPADTSSPAIITVDSVSVGGVVASSDTVCQNSNSGTLTLTGNTGSILNWEYSTDGGFTWLNISNTTNSQSFNNLSVSTKYRAQVQSGVCPATFSSAATISVDNQSAAGNIFGTTTVCASGNAGTLSLLGNSGSVNAWEFSSDNGVTWTSVPGNNNSYNYNNLTTTTLFRTIVQSGVCPADTTPVATIAVDSVSLGGVVSANDTVCLGNNSGVLNLLGYRGTVTGWEISTDGGTTWFTIANTTTSQGYSNLTTSTSYRANVKNGVCSSASSTPATITVLPTSTAGSITGTSQGCSGAVSGTLVSSGNIGNVVDWQSSTDNGVTWTNLANSSASQMYSNLTSTTWFRVIVQSGACAADTSAPVTVTVFPKPDAMFAVSNVCKGTASVFTNQTTIASGFIQLYQWSFGDNNASVAVNPVHTYGAAGTYTATLVTVSDKGCSDTAAVVTEVFQLPSAAITITGNNPFCSGQTISLSGPAGGYSYLWNTSDTVQSISVSTAGTFVLTVTDTATLCSNRDSVITTINPSPVAFAGKDTSVSLGNSITLTGTGGVSFSWSPSVGLSSTTSATVVASPLETTIYVLTVTDENGCTDMDSVTVTVNLDYTFTPSNLITPNGDGFNDTWFVDNIDQYSDSKVMIFNRSGQMIFTAAPYMNDWAATYNGDRIPDGTYYYVITFSGSGKVFKGTITVLTEENKN